MFFSAEDDDQDFMSAGSGSRLANLFGIDKASSQGGNESLTYTAPKQPKSKEPTPQSEGAPSVLFATAVTAYKYVDGKYASQGKLGAAILANHSSSDYRVLLYVSKQQQVTNAKITPAFVFTVQPNNYAIMYDDTRQTWSLLFDSEQNLKQFAKNIGLAKALSSGSGLDNIVSQDLTVGEGSPVESGSSVEVKYTGWLLTNNTFGQEFDSNEKSEKMFRFQIGKGKVIKGWDTGVVGMKRGMARLLIVPPSFGYGSKGAGNKIPPNSTLTFEITIVRVKGDKSASPSPSPAPETVPETTPSPVPDHEDHTVKERTKSISDQMSAPNTGKSGKARLISKMAKMGQPILPMMGGAAPAEPEVESEEEEEGSIEPPSPQPISESPPQHQKTKPKFTKPKPVHAQPVVQTMPQQYLPQQQPIMSQTQPAFVQNLPGAQQLALYQPAQPAFGQPQFQQPQTSLGQMPPNQPVFTQYQQPQGADTQILPVLTENRQQTTELRISMGKVSDKVDRILEKVEFLQNQQNGQLSLQSSQPNMEASVLMHNVQRIVQENDRLRKEGYEKSSKIESLNSKISELLQSNQQYVEKSQTLLEQRNEGFISTASQSQARVLALEQEKVQLTTELSNATALYSSVQLELTNLRKKEIEYQQKLGSSSNDSVRLQEELEALRTQKLDDSQKITELSSNYKEEKQRRKHLETQMSQIQEDLNDIKTSKETLEKTLSDRKKKAAEEKRTMEEEFEETKEQLEKQIQTLRDKLRKAKTSTDSAAAEQVSQLEEELNKEWKEKCDKLLAAQQEKHNRALREVKEENEELQSNVKQLEQKIQDIKSSSNSTDSQITALQEQVEELSVWKGKYDHLRNQASEMKEKYEEQISELESERDEMEQERDQAIERAKKQQEVALPSGAQSSSQSVVGEVKKIMNSVYRELKEKFDADESYTGANVLGEILNSIKSTTLKLVQSQPPQKEEEESESEEDDSEEEVEEEECQGDEEEESEEDENTATVEEEKDENLPENEIKEEKSETSEKNATLPPDLPEIPNEISKTETDQSESSFQNDITEQDNVETNKQDISKNAPKEGMETENDNKQDTVETSDSTPVENESKSEESESTPAESESKPSEIDTSENKESEETIVTNETKAVKEEETGPSKPKLDLSDFDIPKVEKSNKLDSSPTSAIEPPPLFEEENSTERNHSDSLFGDDDHVEDTLGISFKKEESKTPKKKPSKTDLLEDDMRPEAPPPLFGDEDDDDDLDWLS